MNDVNEAVNTATKYASEATEGGFPVMLILLLVIVGGVFFYLFKSGIIGKEDRAKIKADIRKLKGELAAKVAKVTAMDEDDEAVMLPPAAATGPAPKDKAKLYAEADAAFAAGHLNQVQLDAAKVKIATE